ncbi:MAG: hypothetical protein NTW25_02600 [Candidatus Kapabacteria bacterium]|nr:hypothetical protein [Candidatus Kapabacteria bacterium]
MSSVTLEKLNLNIDNYFLSAINNNEELLITSDYGNLVMINENEWNRINETLNLLSDKISLNSLLISHKERENGIEPESYSINEVFSEIYFN